MKNISSEDEKLLFPFTCDTPPFCFENYVFFKRGGVVYYIDTTREKQAEKLFSPNIIPSVFEIKRHSDKCGFLFGEAKGGKINFLSPTPISVSDFFKKKSEKDGEKDSVA